MRIAVGLAALLLGCVESSSVRCPSGTLTCPELTTCVVAADTEWCATVDQLAVCNGQPDAMQCEVSGGPGSCFDGVCLPAGCGNARVDFDEQCDDANATAGDGCSIDCRSNETCGNGVTDGVTGEQCDDNNRSAHDGCSVSCTLESVGWERMGILPPARYGATMTYDADRDRVLLFGGFTISPSSTDLDDLWSWDGFGWARLTTAIRPSPRTYSSMAFDAARHEVVLFGGVRRTQPVPEGADPVGLEDTWLWNGTGWRTAAVTAPPGRSMHTLAYDGAAERVVMYGGHVRATLGNDPLPLDDTWAWDGTQWSQICDPCGPGSREDYAMAYDPVRGVVVLFGGSDGVAVRGDTWVLSGSTWTQVATSGPPARTAARLAFDAASGTLVLAGGLDENVNILLDTWTWDGTQWTASVSTTGKSPVYTASASDPVRGTVVAFGGSQNDSTGTNETEVWSQGAWTSAAVAVPTPENMASAYDASRGAATFVVENEMSVWESDGLSWRSAGTIAGIVSRYGFAMAYDSTHRQLVLFGGSNAVDLADTWLRTDGTWTLAGTGTNARSSHGMAFDGTQVIVFGGMRNGNTETLGDTWAWNGSAWTQLAPATSPSARALPQMAYDPAHDRLVLFGGRDAQLVALDDLWEWNGTTWTQIATPVRPPGRYNASFAFDPMRQRLVMFGGRNSNFIDLDDTWELDGSTWRQLVVENHPVAQNGSGFAPTPHGLLLSGNNTGSWRLAWESIAPVEDCGSGLDLDGDSAIGCDDADCWWTCTPACPPATSCDPSTPRCGDGTCNVSEDCRTCAADCGECSACGDARCQAGEASCAGDCTL